eukprot:5693603-Pyramimonas_sp.AAC.1
MHYTRKSSNAFAPQNALHAPNVLQPQKVTNQLHAPNLLHHPLVAGPPLGSTRLLPVEPGVSGDRRRGPGQRRERHGHAPGRSLSQGPAYGEAGEGPIASSST